LYREGWGLGVGGDKSWGGNGYKPFGLQVARATEFCAIAPIIGGF